LTANAPLVSVVLPSYNAMPYLPVAVQSVIEQTFADWELIVIDDGSTDDTSGFLSAVHDDRIRSLRLDHTSNPARVRNAGLRQAHGRYIAFLDADDTWLPRKLELQLRALRSEPACRWSYTAGARMDATGAPLFDARIQRWVPYDGWILEPLLRIRALIAMPTVIVARDLLAEVGGFDEELTYCEDYDLWFRLALRNRVCVLSEPLARIRVHAPSYSRDRAAVHESWIRVYEKMGFILRDPRLRRLCASRRVHHVVTLARSYGAQSGTRAAFRTLFSARPYAWPFPRWWWSIARAAVRPFVPAGIRRMYRRHHDHVETRAS
jgi:glycosyltransferase involved in cell wall biosynthesis